MRSVTSAEAAALASDRVRAVLLVELDFAAGFVRFANTTADVQYGGNTFVGAGSLLGIDAIGETGQVGAKGMRISISGVPSANLSLAIGQQYQRRAARVYVALYDDDGSQVGVRLIHRGLMDTMPIVDGPSMTIAVTVENWLIDLYRARAGRYNDADQQSRHPGDRFLEFVDDLSSDKEIKWGEQ